MLSNSIGQSRRCFRRNAEVVSFLAMILSMRKGAAQRTQESHPQREVAAVFEVMDRAK